ncbi:hypothetical protein XENOCAPTIV_011273 [Xenoophorus captivus]|uniref:Uncharacterized protein n=1 Tax=Xenoophorus captivus TaxID=1517983 RepID=A0ABV0QHR2_9TELE
MVRRFLIQFSDLEVHLQNKRSSHSVKSGTHTTIPLLHMWLVMQEDMQPSVNNLPASALYAFNCSIHHVISREARLPRDILTCRCRSFNTSCIPHACTPPVLQPSPTYCNDLSALIKIHCLKLK